MKNKLLIIAVTALFALTHYSCATDAEGQNTNVVQKSNLTADNKAITNETANTETGSNTSSAVPIHLTTATFKEKVFNYETSKEWKYNGNLPCIIDFYADWCGPCKRIAPILEDLAIEYEGKIIIYKVNTENEQELAAVFGIQSIPTLLFVPLNEQPQLAQGALPKETFKDAIENVLLKKSN